MSKTCNLEFPNSFLEELTATLEVELLEKPSHEPTNIIHRGQEYEVEVKVELGASLKQLVCGEWCITVASEGIGTAGECKDMKVIDMGNCDNIPDSVTFTLGSKFFPPGPDNVAPDNLGDTTGGDVYYLVVTAVALERCDHKPIGIAGFCRLGPVMVFGEPIKP